MAQCTECGQRYIWQVIANECAAMDRLREFGKARAIKAEPKKCPMHCTAFQWDGKCIHTQGNEAEPKKCPMHCTAFQWDGKCIHTQGNEEAKE